MTVLRSPLRPVLRSPLYSPLVGKWGGAFSPSALFQSGDILLWYDPSDLTTMFKNTAGTQPVTADGDSVALMLDKGQWGGKTLEQVLAAQPELVVGGIFSAPVSISDAGSANQSIGTTVGKSYYVSYRVTAFSGPGNTRLSLGTTGLGVGRTATGTYSEIIYTPAGSTPNVLYAYISASTSATFEDISVKEIPGYHRVQATGTSMPKYKTGPNPAASAPYIHWLLYDGTDDSHATGTITWGTDEVAACVGLTKSSDAAAGVFAELSTNAGAQAGAFGLYAPGTVAANYFFRSRGSSTSDNVRTPFASPITNVVTGMAEIAADTNILRIDDTEETVATDQGTGNYGNHVLYFGRRNNTSVPFNGREYQTVIRSRLLSAAELSSLETFVAAKTGVVL